MQLNLKQQLIIFSLFPRFLLIKKTERGVDLFSHSFNPAISAVINADRDLYQARVAELDAVIKGNVKSRTSFEENAQQAFDRMQKYKNILADHPKILSKLDKFEPAFDAWKMSADEVFKYVESGQLDKAREQSYGPSHDTFSQLRDFFDTAGEAVDSESLIISDKVTQSVSSSLIVLMIISAIVIILTLLAGISAPKAMSNALLALSKQLKELNSGDGDLTRRINSQRKDEIGDVANNLDALMDGWSNLIGSILNQSTQVINGVVILSDGAVQIKSTSQQQAEKVDLIVTAVNEMSYAVKEVAKNAQLTATEIDQVNMLTDQGKQVTQDSVDKIEQLSATIDHASTVIMQLSEKSQDIASVLDVIKGIAEQTNLLALNAAIEAARAGEQGRGFAVVADEVRNLASRTQESTQSIQGMIEALETGVGEAVNSITAGSDATKATVELSQKVLESLNQIENASAKVSDVASQTATATEEQSQVAEEINTNMVAMSDSTQSTFDIAQQNSDQANETKNAAQSLSDTVSRFKLS